MIIGMVKQCNKITILQQLQHKQLLFIMSDQYEDDILVSIRSDNSSDYGDKKNKPKSPHKMEIKPNNNYNYRDRNNDLQIRETLDFGASIRQDNKLYARQQLIKHQKKSSGSSDWNQDDTEELIGFVEASKQDKKRKSYDQQTNAQTYNIKQAKQKQLQRPSYKYPQLDHPIGKSSPKKQMLIDKKPLKDTERQQRVNLGNSYDNQQIYVSISMIGERSSLGGLQKQKIQKIEQKRKKEEIEQKNQIIDNPYKSVYLSNAQLEQKKANVVLKVMDRTMYWIYESKQLKITSQALQGMAQQFFKKQIMLPLISESQLKSNHVSSYMQLYTEFLNYFYPDIFKAAFNIVKASVLSGSKMDLGSGLGSSTPKANQSIGKGLYDQYLSKFFKNTNYSKAQLMRNFMIKKLSMLQILQRKSKQNNNEQNYRFNQHKKSIQKQIALLQLLVSFERSQNECTVNSKQGIDHKIWRQHGKKLKELRKKWITKIESDNHDFSFDV